MIFAFDENAVRIEAAPRRKGVCPICGETMRAKCGEINIWHWAHLAKIDCDPWAECETEWHRSWKLRADPEKVEVPMGPHRADIVACDGAVIELQNSAISVEEIREREAFYGKMIWLINGEEFKDQLRVEVSPERVGFTWSHARPTWRYARKPVFIHGFSLGSHLTYVDRVAERVSRRWQSQHEAADILQIRSIKWGKQVTGSARIITCQRFCERMFQET